MVSGLAESASTSAAVRLSISSKACLLLSLKRLGRVPPSVMKLPVTSTCETLALTLLVVSKSSTLKSPPLLSTALVSVSETLSAPLLICGESLVPVI